MDKLTAVSSFTFYVNDGKVFELSEINGFTVRDFYGKEIKYVRRETNE